jgi:hypothetical protein
MIALIDFTDQTVTLGDNLEGLGYLPAATPAHHEDRETGMNLRTCLILSRPVCGSSCISGIFESFDISCPPLLSLKILSDFQRKISYFTGKK